MDISSESLMNLGNSKNHALKTDEASQLVSLRQFNTSLLEQVAELRKGELERSQLQHALADQQTIFRQQKDDLARKLSALTDENWAKALEIESLEAIRSKESVAVQSLKDQLSEAQARIEELSWQKEHDLEQSKDGFNRQIAQLKTDLTSQLDETQKLTAQNLQNIETFRTFEHQANTEIARMRSENAQIIKNLGEMQSGFKKQLDLLVADNNKLRQLLNVRDTQAEERHENLTIWQKQLTEFDQHLSHTKGSLKQERTNLLHLAMQFENTIRLTAGHPFKDYLEVTEREVIRLQSQITSISEISPLRPKIEERLQQLKQQADAMRAGLTELDHKQNERLSAVAAITKSLGTIPEFDPATAATEPRTASVESETLSTPLETTESAS